MGFHRVFGSHSVHLDLIPGLVLFSLSNHPLHPVSAELAFVIVMVFLLSVSALTLASMPKITSIGGLHVGQRECH